MDFFSWLFWLLNFDCQGVFDSHLKFITNLLYSNVGLYISSSARSSKNDSISNKTGYRAKPFRVTSSNHSRHVNLEGQLNINILIVKRHFFSQDLIKLVIKFQRIEVRITAYSDPPSGEQIACLTWLNKEPHWVISPALRLQSIMLQFNLFRQRGLLSPSSREMLLINSWRVGCYESGQLLGISLPTLLAQW